MSHDHSPSSNPGIMSHYAANTDDLADDAIHASARIPASLERVWAAWTSTDGITGWLSDSARVELRIGGPFEIHFLTSAPEGSRGSEGCRILSFVPRRMLSFSWNAPPQFADERGQHTWVVVEFEPEGDGTTVRLTHLGWPASGLKGGGRWREVFGYFEAAWPRVLDGLERHFSGA